MVAISCKKFDCSFCIGGWCRAEKIVMDGIKCTTYTVKTKDKNEERAWKKRHKTITEAIKEADKEYERMVSKK